MNKQNIVVFLNEEYGYRTFEWSLNMTQEEFVNWWNNLTDSDIIKFYFNMKSLPGTLKQQIIVTGKQIGRASCRERV